MYRNRMVCMYTVLIAEDKPWVLSRIEKIFKQY